MEFTERIKKIQKYFEQFNIVKDIAYVAMNFPEKWTETDYREIGKKNDVVIEIKNGKVLFFIDTNDEITRLFDTIDEIIAYNEQLEIKTALLKKKAKELTDLFATESLEKLETLTFTFEKKKSVKTKKKPVKKENKTDDSKEQGEKSTEEVKKSKPKKSDLMDFAENEIIGGV